VLIDRNAVDPFHGEVGILRIGDARIVKLRNMRMRQSRKNIPLSFESTAQHTGH
jgi:hypothetical protein